MGYAAIAQPGYGAVDSSVDVFAGGVLDVHEAARLRELAAAGRDMAEIVQWVNGPAVVDELYQPAYCDLCGAELSPDGSCNHCGN